MPSWHQARSWHPPPPPTHPTLPHSACRIRNMCLRTHTHTDTHTHTHAHTPTHTHTHTHTHTRTHTHKHTEMGLHNIKGSCVHGAYMNAFLHTFFASIHSSNESQCGKRKPAVFFPSRLSAFQKSKCVLYIFWVHLKENLANINHGNYLIFSCWDV